jgi:DNA polymerase-1
VLVRCDYPQCQVRAVARVTGAADLTADLAAGRDIPTDLAVRWFGASTVSAAARAFAKRAFFAPLFGAAEIPVPTTVAGGRGPAAIRLEVVLAAYPGLALWYNPLRPDPTGELRTPQGRRIHPGGHISATTALSYVCQGVEADGLKLALVLLWERRAACPGAVPVLAVHDEIVVEAPAGQEVAATVWLTDAMADGMAECLGPVPVGRLDPRVRDTWAD